MQKGLNFLFWLLVLALFASFWLHLQPSQSQLAAAHVATVVSTSRPGTPTPVPSLTPPPTNPPETATAGSPDAPLTDSSLILKIVQQLADQERNYILSNSGWLHLTSQLYYLPTPAGNNISDGLVNSDSWYLLQNGFYQTALDLHNDSNGQTLRQAIFNNGLWQTISPIQMELPPAPQNQSQPLALDSSDALAEIGQNIASAITTIGWQEESGFGLTFVVVQQFVNSPPVEVIGLNQPIQGSITRYVFAWQTGQLVWKSYELQHLDQTWLTVSSRMLISSEFVNELPPEIQTIYDQMLSAREQ